MPPKSSPKARPKTRPKAKAKTTRKKLSRTRARRSTVNASGNTSLHNVLIPCYNDGKCGWQHMPRKGNDRSAVPRSLEFRSGETRISLPRVRARFSYDLPTFQGRFSNEQFDAVALALKSIHDSQKSNEFELILQILGDTVSWSRFQRTNDVSTKSIKLELYDDYDMFIGVNWSIAEESFVMNVIMTRPWLDKLYYASIYENVNWAETLGITPPETGLGQDIGAVIARNM